MRQQPDNPTMLFCSLFDYTASYNGRDTMLAAYLDSAMHHAVTSREKCEVYLRLAAYNAEIPRHSVHTTASTRRHVETR